MSQNDTKDLELPDTTPKDPAEVEKTRLAELMFKEAPYLSAKYRALIQHKGSLLSESMTYAYSKGINDAIKLILKETNKNGKS